MQDIRRQTQPEGIRQTRPDDLVEQARRDAQMSRDADAARRQRQGGLGRGARLQDPSEPGTELQSVRQPNQRSLGRGARLHAQNSPSRQGTRLLSADEIERRRRGG